MGYFWANVSFFRANKRLSLGPWKIELGTFENHYQDNPSLNAFYTEKCKVS